MDDLIILAKAPEIMDATKQMLAKRFKMKDLGQIHYCLDITIEQRANKSFVMQYSVSSLTLKPLMFLTDCG